MLVPWHWVITRAGKKKKPACYEDILPRHIVFLCSWYTYVPFSKLPRVLIPGKKKEEKKKKQLLAEPRRGVLSSHLHQRVLEGRCRLAENQTLAACVMSLAGPCVGGSNMKDLSNVLCQQYAARSESSPSNFQKPRAPFLLNVENRHVHLSRRAMFLCWCFGSTSKEVNRKVSVSDVLIVRNSHIAAFQVALSSSLL